MVYKYYINLVNLWRIIILKNLTVLKLMNKIIIYIIADL